MKQTKKITILHSNDLHGDFLAEQVDEKLVGGVALMMGNRAHFSINSRCAMP